METFERNDGMMGMNTNLKGTCILRRYGNIMAASKLGHGYLGIVTIWRDGVIKFGVAFGFGL